MLLGLMSDTFLSLPIIGSYLMKSSSLIKSHGIGKYFKQMFSFWGNVLVHWKILLLHLAQSTQVALGVKRVSFDHFVFDFVLFVD